MKLKPSIKAAATAIAATATILSTSTALAWIKSPYRVNSDRFTGNQSAIYDPEQKDCRLTKSAKGSLYSCMFMYSTESSEYPILSFLKQSNGWDLLAYGRKMDAPSIVTFKDGTTKQLNLSASLGTDVISGGTVSEIVTVRLGALAGELENISLIEVQYGSSEFAWAPTKEAVCVMKLSPTC